MHPVQSIGYVAAYPAYPLNPPLFAIDIRRRRDALPTNDPDPDPETMQTTIHKISNKKNNYKCERTT